jgi:hypothetical protein
MTAQIFERTAGDSGPDIVKVLSGTGSLTAVSTVLAYVYRKREPTTTIVATVTNPSTRTVSADMSTWLPTARSGDWKIKYRVTFTDTEKQTWEPGRPDVIRVGKNPAT